MGGVIHKSLRIFHECQNMIILTHQDLALYSQIDSLAYLTTWPPSQRIDYNKKKRNTVYAACDSFTAKTERKERGRDVESITCLTSSSSAAHVDRKQKKKLKKGKKKNQLHISWQRCC